MTNHRSMKDISVLYVEDEPTTRSRLAAMLQREVRQVFEAADGRDGHELYMRLRPDVVVTDLRMPRMDGLQMSREIKKADPEAEIIVASAHNDASLLLGAIEAGISGYLLKPIDAGELMSAIGKVTERKQLQKALRKSERHFRSLVEQAPDPLLVYERASGKIIECNQQACDLFLLKREELLKHTMAEIEVFDHFDHSSDILADAGKAPVSVESVIRRSDGCMVPVETRIGLLEQSEPQAVIMHIRDISLRKLAETERENLIVDLRKALDEIKTLQGIVPICSYCKNVRDDKGFWKRVEAYVTEHTGLQFSHGLCPDCFAKYFPEQFEKNKDLL